MLDFEHIRTLSLELAEEYGQSPTMIAEFILDGYTVQQLRDGLDVAEACSISLTDALADCMPSGATIPPDPTPSPPKPAAAPVQRFTRRKPNAANQQSTAPESHQDPSSES